MDDRKSVSWMLTLCVTTSLLAGCDHLDEPDEAIQELGPAAVAVWPPAEFEAVGETTVMVMANVPEAVPAQAGFPQKNLSPSDDLMIGWLRWALAQPNDDGPIADTTGEKCAIGQEGPVWYLAGTFGGSVVRECDIPAGKQLFFPLVNRWCVFPPEFYSSWAEIVAVLPLLEAWYDAKHAATCELTLRLDGQDLRPDFASLDEDTYIKVMEPFEIDLNEHHWAEGYFAGGIIPTTGDGNYALLQPLTPGDHVLELGGTVCGNYPFQTAATYILHVGE
jgi:hypothetical protein